MRDQTGPKRSSGVLIIWILLALALAGLAYFLFKPSDTAIPAPAKKIVKVEEPVKQPETPVLQEYEAPQDVVAVEPLPTLNNSHSSILENLKSLGSESLLSLLASEELIRKFVLAVNGIQEGKVVYEYRPVVSPQPPFVVESFNVMVDGNEVSQERVDNKNYARYEPYVRALALVDPDAAVDLYKRYYPLLEEAFRELGLKKKNFHSVMIGAIDNILAAPDIQGDLLLLRPKVFYQYADPALEKLPQTHKLMLRMGPENARSVKASLRQLRARLIKVN
jgi:Protein of unknown function (DUF3014)